MAVKTDAVGNPERTGQGLQSTRLGSGPEDLRGEPTVVSHRPEQDVNTFVDDEPADEADSKVRSRRRPVDGVEAFDVDTEGQEPPHSSEPFPTQDLPGLGVAGVRPGGPPQGPTLEPAERHRIPLVDVLGRRHEEGEVRRADSPQHQHLGDGQAEWFFVHVEQIPRSGSEEPPQRTGIVEEEVRMSADRTDSLGEPVALGGERHHRSALFPVGRGDQGKVGPLATE